MNKHTFDHVTRRASLAALGAAGLAGLLGQDTSTSAKQSPAKKANQQAKKKCQNQISQCIGSVKLLCDENQVCEKDMPACCQKLTDCNFDAFLTCAFDTFEG